MWHRRFIFACGLICLIALAGCQTASPEQLSGSLRDAAAAGPTGRIVGSLFEPPEDDDNGPGFTGFRLFFRRQGTKERGSLFYRTGLGLPGIPSTIRDFNNAAGRGVVFDVKLPPGDYEIYDFAITGSRSSATVVFGARENFSLPFRVVAGRTTYLGRVNYRPVIGRNLFGIPMMVGGYFLLGDGFEPDFAVLRTKGTAPAKGAVDRRPLDASGLNLPYFRAP